MNKEFISQYMSDDMYDVSGFCKAHKISRALFYSLLKAGKGPRITKLGRRTLITKEAAGEWRASVDGQAA